MHLYSANAIIKFTCYLCSEIQSVMPQLKVNTDKTTPSVFPFTFKTKSIFLIVLSFILYANTLQNGYLLDDNMTITQNDYVQQGFSGIPDILTHDSFDSFMKKTGLDKHKLSGGRYRPLSIIIFAIEHSLFGESTFLRHLINIFFYSLLVFVLFYFLDKFLFASIKGGRDIAFLAATLFAVHPIHVEAVANIKSLDEILSLLLIFLTFISVLFYFKNKKILFLILGLLCYFFALLAKEYAITLLILLPILFYLIGNKKPIQAIVSSLPYLGIFILYIIIRLHAIGLPGHWASNDISINPYLFATPSQAIATKLFVLEKYLFMLFIPYPLSYDYNYAQIPYQNFVNIPVTLSILLYTGITAWGIWLVYKKNILAFPVLFFLLNLTLVSNFLMNIGATMGERLIFHSSLGFVTILSYGLLTAVKKLSYKIKQATIFTLLTLLIIVFGIEIWNRNMVWKNFETITTHDVHTVPNSIIANNYAAMSYIYLSEIEKDSVKSKILLRQAVDCGLRAVHIMQNYYDAYVRLGTAYTQLNSLDSAIYYLSIAKNIRPDSNSKKYLAHAYLLNGCYLGKKGDMNEAIQQMLKGTNETPADADIWYNLGGAYYVAHKYDSARFAWTRTLQLDPSNSNAKNGLNALP